MTFLASYDEAASPSAPIAWMRDFAEARHRLRDWVSLCGTRLARDRPTRQTRWPGEPADSPADGGGEVEIRDRRADFDDLVRTDVLRRHRMAVLAPEDVVD